MVTPVPVTRWLVGLSAALISCFLSSLGLTLQRLSALREAERFQLDGESGTIAPPKKKCSIWLLGVAIYVIAAAPDVISYVLIPQVICSAVACFRLVVVTVMASVVLKERLTRSQTIGMALCSIGTFLCLCFGPVRMEKAVITSQFSSPKVAIYLILGIGVLVLLFVFDHWRSFSGKGELSARCRIFTLPLMTGLAYAISKVFNSEIGFIPFPHNLWDQPQWLFMAIAISLLGLTDLYLNLRATRLIAVQVFVPVSFVWCIGLQYFQSVILFRELSSLSSIHVVLSLGGAMLSLLGAIFIQLPQLDCCKRLKQPKPEGLDGMSLRSISGVSLVEDETGKAGLFLESQ